MLAKMDAAAQRSWRENGYVVLRNSLTQGEADRLGSWSTEIESWPEAPGKWMKYFEAGGNGERRLCRVENFIPYHDGLAEFLADAMLFEVLGALLGEPALLYKEKINFKLPGGAGFAPHQDAPAFATFGQDFHITAMIPIDEMTAENGCLEVVDGIADRELLPQEGDGTIGRDWVEGQVWRDVPLGKRDLILFDSYLAHRSGPNRSAGPRRALYVTYNGASQGDRRLDYYARKREVFPPECEREPGSELSPEASAFNLGNPIR